MTILEALAAIDAAPLTVKEKRRRKRRVRIQALANLLDNLEERTFVRGEVTVTVTEAQMISAPFFGNDLGRVRLLWTKDLNGDLPDAIILRFHITRGTTLLRHPNEPLIIEAPQFLVPDDMDPSGYREDIRAAFRARVAALIRDGA